MNCEKDFDHPCKDTCSGWNQGYRRGVLDAARCARESDIPIPMEIWMKPKQELTAMTAFALADEIEKLAESSPKEGL